MNSGASLSIGSAGQTGEALAISSCHQRSRPSCMVTSMPMRRTTTHFSTVGDFSRARSAFCFSGNVLAAPPAGVGGDHQLGGGVVVAVGDGLGRETAEDHRVDRADPAQASMAMGSSGIIGM